MAKLKEPEAVELYRKHRPTKFSEMVGVSDQVAKLKAMAEGGNIPHVLLLTGPSGTGKTTMARIVASKLGCNLDIDFQEINASRARGIDDVRAIIDESYMKPLGGDARVLLIDECFPAGTLVNTPQGSIPIESVRVGTVVDTITGPSKVLRTFTNRVSTDHVIKLHLSDGTSVVTTESHRFLTISGWVEAQHLQGHCIYGIFCYPMSKSSHRSNHDLQLRMVSQGLHTVSREQAEGSGACLLPFMCQPHQRAEEGQRKN